MVGWQRRAGVVVWVADAERGRRDRSGRCSVRKSGTTGTTAQVRPYRFPPVLVYHIDTWATIPLLAKLLAGTFGRR